MGRRLLACLVLAIGGFAAFAAPAQAAGTPLYPNLRTLPPDSVRFATVLFADNTSHLVLEFGNTATNMGEGTLQLRAEPLDTDTATAYQRVLDAGGNLVFERVVGQFIFHPQHNHYHLEDFALYQLWTKAGYDAWIASGRTSGAPIGTSTKVTFCLEDVFRIQPLPGSPTQPQYTICSQTGLSGISVGWGDWYPRDVYGQWIDLNGSPLTDGDYVLRSVADPDNLIWESPNGADPSRESQVDNEATTPLRVSGGIVYEGLLSDGFENGLGAWTAVKGVTTQSVTKFAGSFAARAVASGSPAYLSRDIRFGRNAARVDARFDLRSQTTRAGLAMLRNVNGKAIGQVFVGSGGRIGLRNAITGATVTGAKVSRNVWHELEWRLDLTSGSDHAQVWLDGVPAFDVTGDFGNTKIGRAQVGDPAAGRTFDEVFDNVVLEGFR